MAEAPNVMPVLGTLGTNGLNRWGNDVFEEFLPNLRWPRAGKIYQEMASNDAVVTAIMLTTRQLINGVSWSVTPASSSKQDQEAAEFLKSCMFDMVTPWSSLIEEITSYFDYGWAYHELIYKKREGYNRSALHSSQYEDGRIGWAKIPGRSQSSWDGWEFDDKEDTLLGMWQKTNNSKSVFIPASKALLFRTTAARNNPEGKSFLRGAYRAWYFKKHIEEIEGIGIERDLAGLPVLTAPEGMDIWDTSNENNVRARTAGERIVRSVRRDRNEGILLPNGWDFKLVSSGGSKTTDTNQVINRWDQRIAITMLADIVMLGADKVGSFALADVKKSLLAAALDAQVHSIADIFNRAAIPQLFRYNVFPGITKTPTIKATPVDAPDMAVLATYIEKLAKTGMPLFPNIDLENHLRRIANLPETSEEDEARKPENRLNAVKQPIPKKEEKPEGEAVEKGDE